MTLDDAIASACQAVCVSPPKRYSLGRWSRTNAVGRNGKGDGSVMVEQDRATAYNWQTGEKHTVWINGERSAEDRRRSAQIYADRQREQKQVAEKAARIAQQLINAARMATHPYLAAKGFRDEMVMTVDAATVRHLTDGRYAVSGDRAIVVPARHSGHTSTVQLIWEDGTKKFIYGGEVDGASHRVATGSETWLCEGFATALSLRVGLQSLHRSATVLVCFSAANILAVSRSIKGRAFIAADHDKPIEHFDFKGTGEHYAKLTGLPFVMPGLEGDDINDVHRREGIFAVQALILRVARPSVVA